MQHHYASEAKGLFRSLFDFSFSSLIANRVIKFLYGLITILATLSAVLIFVQLARQGGNGTAVAVIVVPLYLLIYLIFTRIFMEVLIVFFRMGDDVRAIREQGQANPAAPRAFIAPPPPAPRPAAAAAPAPAPPAPAPPAPAPIPPASQFPPPPPPRGY